MLQCSLLEAFGQDNFLDDIDFLGSSVGPQTLQEAIIFLWVAFSSRVKLFFVFSVATSVNISQIVQKL